MLRKNIDLIIDAFLLIAVLGIAFWSTYAKAKLNPSERAEPGDSGAYYRTPGKNGRWFGPEINSLTLCKGVHNPYNNRGFFDIIETIENAVVSKSRINGALHWYRRQEWKFANDDTPWGTNYFYITLSDDLGWSEIHTGRGGTTGYPWSGIERHWRDGNIIRAHASVMGWRQYSRGRERWICPMYYKIGGWQGESLEVHCKTLRTWFPPDWNVLAQKYGHFGTPVERKPGVISRKGKRTNRWFDCIKLN
ncbi:MAG: hypothetical protein OXD54_18205 [Candidatus Poribacteria bacterium]|nr:hypothetical protein [Candidatus Poribacteria bacterium]